MSWDTDALAAGPVPRWHQIAERLRAAILAGEFGPGDALPSESELNRRFGVSRTTARASLDRLKEDGLISRRSGKGSIVLAPSVVGGHALPDREALDASSLYDWLRETCGAHIGGGQELIGATAATPKQVRALDVEKGAPLLVAERTCHTLDGSPIEHATVHYRPDRYRFRVDLANP